MDFKCLLCSADLGNDKVFSTEDLLKLVKTKGVLVETILKEKCGSFLFDIHKEYKQSLGAVPVKDKHGNITNVYVVYEDFDGSIKYYDYPEYTQKEIKKMRKAYKKD